MRVLLLALMLGLACTPLSAQTEREPRKAKPDRPQGKDSQPHKGQASTSRKQQVDPARPQDQRARERVPGDPPPDHRKHSVSRDAQPPTGSPSPAQMQQRKMEEQRRIQQGQPGNDRQFVFQCSARPVCGGSGYGRCSSVQQTYRGGTEQSRRQDIINDCIQANSPDTCGCAVQCRRVAQCSTF